MVESATVNALYMSITTQKVQLNCRLPSGPFAGIGNTNFLLVENRPVIPWLIIILCCCYIWIELHSHRRLLTSYSTANLKHYYSFLNFLFPLQIRHHTTRYTNNQPMQYWWSKDLLNDFARVNVMQLSFQCHLYCALYMLLNQWVFILYW